MVEERRGVGGKLRKPSMRKPPASPYARPPEGERQRSRWLSKVVGPACRLISGGATLIFPSFFSRSDSISDNDAGVEGVQQILEQKHVDNDHECISDTRSNHEDLGGGYRSLGSIRRRRRNAKLQSPRGGSRFVHSSVNGSMQLENSRTLEGLNPVAAKNMESWEIGLRITLPPESKWAFTSDSGSGFNFPVTESASVLSELIFSW